MRACPTGTRGWSYPLYWGRGGGGQCPAPPCADPLTTRHRQSQPTWLPLNYRVWLHSWCLDSPDRVWGGGSHREAPRGADATRRVEGPRAQPPTHQEAPVVPVCPASTRPQGCAPLARRSARAACTLAAPSPRGSRSAASHPPPPPGRAAGEGGGDGPGHWQTLPSAHTDHAIQTMLPGTETKLWPIYSAKVSNSGQGSV